MTSVERAAAPGSGVGVGPTWEMGAVTIRRLVAGERLDGADGAVWALVLEGEARLETAAGVEALHSGDAFHVDARSPYRLVALTPVEIAVGAVRAVSPLPGGPQVVRDFARSNRGIVELVRICPLDPRRELPLFAASYGGLIQAAMLRARQEGARRVSDPRLTALVSVLDAHPGRPWTVESMARAAHLSRSSLGERFRRELGSSPAQVLREVRMRHARALLAGTDKPIEQIALTVGYGSLAAFSRAFSAQHGSSPLAWRSRPGGAQHPEADAARERRDDPDQ